MNELTEGWTREALKCSKNKKKPLLNRAGKAVEKCCFTSQKAGRIERSKKVQKKFDDLVAILIVCQTSAEPAVTQVPVKAAGLTNRQGWLLPKEDAID